MRMLLFLSLMISAGASASAKNLIDFNLDNLGHSAPVCPPPKDSSFKDKASAKIAYAKATKAKRPCDAAEAAMWLARADEEPTSENVRWGANAVANYALKGDFHEATVQGLRLLNSLVGEQENQDPDSHFLDEDDADLNSDEVQLIEALNPDELEPVRFAVTQAVFGACVKLGIDRDVTWRNWALNLHPPSSENERSLSLLAYLEDFPKSSNADQVRSQAAQLMSVTIDSELATAEELYQSGKTYAALTRLEYLYRYTQLAESARFSSIVERIVILQDALISELPRMKDSQVRAMLRLSTPGQVDRVRVQTDIKTRLCRVYPTWKQLGKEWPQSAQIKSILQRRCR